MVSSPAPLHQMRGATKRLHLHQDSHLAFTSSGFVIFGLKACEGRARVLSERQQLKRCVLFLLSFSLLGVCIFLELSEDWAVQQVPHHHCARTQKSWSQSHRGAQLPGPFLPATSRHNKHLLTEFVSCHATCWTRNAGGGFFFACWGQTRMLIWQLWLICLILNL